MAIENIKNKVRRLDVAVAGVSNEFSSTENIEGIIRKIAFVSGTMISGNVAITDTHTGENIWSELAVALHTVNQIRYPRVSGSSTAGTLLSDNGANEIGFPTSNATIAMTGITPATGTATCYIYFK